MIATLFIAASGFMAMSALVPATVSAQTGGNPDACGKSIGGFLGLPTWYKYLLSGDGSGSNVVDGQCDIDFNFPDDVIKVLLAVFEVILRIAGLVAVGFVIFGGIQYVLSQGEPEKTKGARMTVINALIGIAVAVSATAIVNLIGNNLG